MATYRSIHGQTNTKELLAGMNIQPILTRINQSGADKKNHWYWVIMQRIFIIFGIKKTFSAIVPNSGILFSVL